MRYAWRRHGLFSVGLLVIAGLGRVAAAQEQGQVQLPLPAYQELLRQLAEEARPAPTGYAMGNATVQLSVVDSDRGARATATVGFTVQILEDEWVLVPLLPPATAVSSATVNGRPVQLVSATTGLMWAVGASGSYDVQLVYRIDAEGFDAGHSLAVPLPPAPSSQVSAVLPGTGLGVAVIPAVATVVSEVGDSTTITANLPHTGGMQISWRTESERGFTMSRADYIGRIEDDSAIWEAEFQVDVATDERVHIGLLREEVALLGIQVDGVEAPISAGDGLFSVALSGRGRHVVRAGFRVQVQNGPGQPRVVFAIPPVPVSHFELTLPGEKEVTVQPRASIHHSAADGSTVSVTNVPMTDRVTFSWSEAVPEEALGVTEVRSNASIYHAAHAEEGVLYVRATTVFEVTRGQTSQFELSVPEGVQINAITAADGGVADWRLSTEGDRRVTVFLAQQVSGEFRFDVLYEQILPSGADAARELVVPLLSAVDVHRQRGMIALLQSRELALEPRSEESVSRVGENQLPAFLREDVDMTIAHTFRYFETSPRLLVAVTAPDRVQGRFDAHVDTLISLGDVTTVGSSTIEVNVKSGSIMDLQLVLPEDVNFLSLSAPSLRGQEITQRESDQVIDVEFTQDLEGQFRVEVTYERINADGEPVLPVPLPHVEGAEVEQGRVAIEALSAVEVQAARQLNLSSVDTGELPQRLLMRTTNPILLAFKYVQADPRPELDLRITQHDEIDVQAAIIDNAHYRTLYTRDGFTVTTANFTVRNSRQQFLRVTLPPGSEVWSAFVNGQSETPAMANGNGDGAPPEVLINIINSARGFPVELIYATPRPALGFRGAVESQLPQPDMVVTHSRWDLYVPDDLSYGTPDTDLDVLEEGVRVHSGELALDSAHGGQPGLTEPLRIGVPISGLRYSFEGLYANQTGRVIAARIPYTSEGSARLGLWLSLVGALLIWLVAIAASRRPRRPTAPWVAGGIVGFGMVVVPIVFLGARAAWALGLSGVFVLGLVAVRIGRWIANVRSDRKGRGGGAISGPETTERGGEES